MSVTHEENLALVEQANAAGHLAEWARVHAPCPSCRAEWVVDVRQVLRTKPPGTFSLAGVQAKAPARIVWVYKCSACGTQGDAEPR